MGRSQVLASRASRLLLPLGLTVLASFGPALDAAAVPLDGFQLDVTGMNPKLVGSRDQQRIYLMVASPTGKVRAFNTTTLAWESGIPNIAEMSGIDLTKVSCEIGQCWGGPTLAAGAGDELHVVWGEKGLNDCDPAKQFQSAVRLKYSHYDGSSWSSPATTIVSRRMDQNDPECVYQFPNLAEDGAGNMLLSYMHGVYVCPAPCGWDEGTHYYTYTPSEAWQYRGRIAKAAASSHTAGGFGRLLLGYGHGHVAEIDPDTGAAISDEVLPALPGPDAPSLFLAGANDLHALFGRGVNNPAHTTEIYYNHQGSGGWLPSSLLISGDPTIFVPPATGEYTAVTSLATTPSGRRLLSFSYGLKLYFVFYDGTWGAPMEATTGTEVRSQAVHAIGDAYYLVVWSTDLSPTAEIWWALVPAGPCASCAATEVCQNDACVCREPLCNGVCCGAGGTCVAGACCAPQCAGMECGDDGCGGSCGECTAPPDDFCVTASTFRVFSVTGQCSGSACEYSSVDVSCPDGCQDAVCAGCVAQGCPEQNKQCGRIADLCGGRADCGSCATDQTCDANNQCVGACVRSCDSRECGDDGCGGVCGTCSGTATCSQEGHCTDGTLGGSCGCSVSASNALGGGLVWIVWLLSRRNRRARALR